jgi:hypothetical protein
VLCALYIRRVRTVLATIQADAAAPDEGKRTRLEAGVMQRNGLPRCGNCGYRCSFSTDASILVKGAALYCSSECMWSRELRASPCPPASNAVAAAAAAAARGGGGHLHHLHVADMPAAPAAAKAPAPSPHADFCDGRLLSPPPLAVAPTSPPRFPGWESAPTAPDAASESGDSDTATAMFELDEEMAATRQRHACCVAAGALDRRAVPPATALSMTRRV